MNYTLAEIKNKKIVLSALDWGMGHLTRCVSIIRTLIEAGNAITFAGNEKQITFIKNDFPNINTIPIDGYNITLDSKKNTYFQLALQSPKLTKAIKVENKWLKKYVDTHKVDVIISDNRYGFFHNKIPSIIITHQLTLQLPRFKSVVNKQIAKKVEKFNACWIPDFEDRLLTGELSKGEFKIPIHFIGALNRFQKLDLPEKYQLLVILSGPEPERTNFLNLAIDYVNDNNILNAAFVGAKVDGKDSFENPTTNQLSQLIAKSNTVFSRAGYTTIMEMVGLNKKAILIPTKGQFEQEYLATFIQIEKIQFKLD